MKFSGSLFWKNLGDRYTSELDRYCNFFWQSCGRLLTHTSGHLWQEQGLCQPRLLQSVPSYRISACQSMQNCPNHQNKPICLRGNDASDTSSSYLQLWVIALTSKVNINWLSWKHISRIKKCIYNGVNGNC